MADCEEQYLYFNKVDKLATAPWLCKFTIWFLLCMWTLHNNISEPASNINDKTSPPFLFSVSYGRWDKSWASFICYISYANLVQTMAKLKGEEHAVCCPLYGVNQLTILMTVTFVLQKIWCLNTIKSRLYWNHWSKSLKVSPNRRKQAQWSHTWKLLESKLQQWNFLIYIYKKKCLHFMVCRICYMLWH